VSSLLLCRSHMHVDAVISLMQRPLPDAWSFPV
jgi:hypothetical protein